MNICIYFFACNNKAILHLPRKLEVKITDEKAKFEVLITKLKQDQAEIDAKILKLEQNQAEKENKKNRKFQTRCIQIAKKIFNEEPIIEYRLLS